ncbi:hypothetical protein, partial [Eikenella corrodens]|uniref:hypothetical protein n=1 Tax=Eikenella corrodens TaxID=539 RepID=UPI00195BE17A
CNEQFDQFVLNGLAEATFSHRNILINFEYSWLSRTAPLFFIMRLIECRAVWLYVSGSFCAAETQSRNIHFFFR